MKKNLKTFTAVLTVFMVLISMIILPGCSKNEAGETEAQTSAVNATSGEKTAEAAKEEPPVTLTVWGPPFEKSFAPGVQEDAVAKEITRRTGVIMDITPMNAVSNYNDKFAAALASNDLPDIAYIQDASIVSKVISAKSALAFDDYLEKYGANILKDTPIRVESARKFLSSDVDGNSDGKMYIWRSMGDTADDPIQVQVAPYMRYDLWEKLGYPAIETMDDYIPVLLEMQKLEPVNKDGKKVYGVSGWFGDAQGWGDWILNGGGWAMQEGYGEIGRHCYIDMTSEEIDSRVLNPDSYYWNAVSWFNKAYRAGILDPDATTMKWDNYLEKANANRILFGWAPWCIDGGNKTFEQDGTPEKGYFQMPPVTKRDRYVAAFDIPQGSYMFIISSKTKYPEKAVGILDFFTSIEGTELILNGVKGEHWDEVNSKPQIKPETLKGLAEDMDYKIKTGVYKYHNMAGRGGSVVDTKYNEPVYFSYMAEIVKERLTPLMKKGVEHFGVTLPGDLYLKNDNIKYTTYNTYKVSLIPPQPEDIREIETKVYNYVQANQIKLMLLKTEAEFNEAKLKFIDDCKKLDAEKTLEWTKQVYAEANAK